MVASFEQKMPSKVLKAHLTRLAAQLLSHQTVIRTHICTLYNIVPEDVESREARDLFIEQADNHVDVELQLELIIIVARQEVEYEADAVVSDDSTQSTTVARQPVHATLVQC